MMRRQKQNDLLTLVQSFFHDYLERVRGASGHTIRAYRDTLRLFFLFLAHRRNGSAADLTLDDLRADAVLAFLDHLQSRRGNSAATRNCRLTVLRSFARHLLRYDLTRAEQYGRILALPSKRATLHVATYLEPEEARAVIAAVDPQSSFGARDQSSGAEEFHLRALPKPDVSLSTHPAPIVQPRLQVANAEAGLAGAISTAPANPMPIACILRPCICVRAQRTTQLVYHAQRPMQMDGQKRP
jgi:hypothetical protein